MRLRISGLILLMLMGCTGDPWDLPPLESCFSLVRLTVLTEWKNPGTLSLEEPLGQRSRGLFVRFVSGNRDRGCLALTQGVDDWAAGLRYAAWDAGFRDPRYPHLRSEEAEALDIEITFMGALTEIKNPLDFDPKIQAIYMIHPKCSVILQPSIPRENLWNSEQTLEALCRKGHLARGAWRDPGTRFFRAPTQSFREPFSKK